MLHCSLRSDARATFFSLLPLDCSVFPLVAIFFLKKVTFFTSFPKNFLSSRLRRVSGNVEVRPPSVSQGYSSTFVAVLLRETALFF